MKTEFSIIIVKTFGSRKYSKNLRKHFHVKISSYVVRLRDASQKNTKQLMQYAHVSIFPYIKNLE